MTSWAFKCSSYHIWHHKQKDYTRAACKVIKHTHTHIHTHTHQLRQLTGCQPHCPCQKDVRGIIDWVVLLSVGIYSGAKAWNIDREEMEIFIYSGRAQRSPTLSPHPPLPLCLPLCPLLLSSFFWTTLKVSFLCGFYVWLWVKTWERCSSCIISCCQGSPYFDPDVCIVWLWRTLWRAPIEVH